MPSSHNKPPVSLIQITDCHLFADSNDTLAGLNCNESLAAVLELVRENHPEFDAFLCTGDLVQDGSEAGYRTLLSSLEAFERPFHWLCGNHDERTQMLRVLGDNNQVFTNQVIYGNWQILLLDSQVPEKIYGYLEQSELDILKTHLEQSAEARMHTLVCLHHNPVPVRATWLQRHSLRNPEQLFAVLSGFDHVRGVINGHIHQELHDSVQGIPVWSAPSTCVQFHPESDEFTLHELNPGYRWLQLLSDGAIETGVNRVAGELFHIDLDSKGY